MFSFKTATFYRYSKGNLKLSRRFLIFHLICDFVSITCAFSLAYWLRYSTDLFPIRPMQDAYIHIRMGLFSGIIGLLCMQVNQIYDVRFRRVTLDLVFSIVRSMAFCGLIVILVSFLFREFIILSAQETMSRIILGISFLVGSILMVLWRLLTFGLLDALRKRGWGQIQILLVGASSEVGEIGKFLYRDSNSYHVLGYCGSGGTTSLPHLGDIDDLKKVIESHGAQEVVMASDDALPQDLLHVMRCCELTGARFYLSPRPSTLLLLPAYLHEINGVPLMVPRRGLGYGIGRLTKRSLDVLFSIGFLVVTMPISLLAALSIRLETTGPVIYRQKRVGLHKEDFWIYKFRSMRADADKLPAPPGPLDRKADIKIEEASDPRVTRVGRWLRRLSIDEFPQFINVLKGDMSIVGPRPHIPSEVERYDTWHHRRFDVKPGITGLTQVSGRKNLDIDGMVKLDVYYIENWSVGLDLKIMLQTIPALLTGRGAY